MIDRIRYRIAKWLCPEIFAIARDQAAIIGADGGARAVPVYVGVDGSTATRIRGAERRAHETLH